MTKCVKEIERHGKRKRSKEYAGAKMDRQVKERDIDDCLEWIVSLILLDTPNSDTERERDLQHKSNRGQQTNQSFFFFCCLIC